jgi:hypothetical protein
MPQPDSIIALQPQPDSKYIGWACWKYMGCGWAIIGICIGAWHGLHMFGAAAARGEAPGITYCGITCDAIGAQGEGQGGGQVAATGAAYVVAGGQHTGAGGGGQTGSRRHQLQGQQGHNARSGPHAAHPPNRAGSVDTASKVSIFFMILCLLGKQLRITAWVESANRPIQTLNGGQMGVGAKSLRLE